MNKDLTGVFAFYLCVFPSILVMKVFVSGMKVFVSVIKVLVSCE